MYRYFIRKNIYQIRILALTIMVLGLFTSQLYSAIPVVTNVSASQRPDTKLVDISYELADADGDSCTVRIEMSDDGGEKYSVPIISISGAIGKNVTPGQKTATWDAGADWDGNFSDQMKVRVIATDKKGYPGLVFGDEVKAGSFVMGVTKDQNYYSSGLTKPINIPWSYHLSKNKITTGQYAEFLNNMLIEDLVDVSIDTADVPNTYGLLKKQTIVVRCNKGLPSTNAFQGDILYKESTRDNKTYIKYDGRRFYPYYESGDRAIRDITLPGALWFAEYYGYDLPTEAEWEKAARGSYNIDGMINSIGAEYTRSRGLPFGNYPSTENLNSDFHKVFSTEGESSYVIRGAGGEQWSNGSAKNQWQSRYENSWARTPHKYFFYYGTNSTTGEIEGKEFETYRTFRVIRRNLP